MSENENKVDDAIKKRIAEIQAKRSRLLSIGGSKMTPSDYRTLRRITVELMTLGGPDFPELRD